MADGTKIEWATATWSPITGCTPVSAGCQNCYASRMIGRGLPKMGHKGPFSSVQFHPDRLDQPLRWKKPRRIFVSSMGDLFHEDVLSSEICEVYRMIKRCRRHTFMILTKRQGRMKEFNDDFAEVLPNLYLGVTAENQEMADQRIPILLQPQAAKRFVSVEPMLGPVDLPIEWLSPFKETDPLLNRTPRLDWVICGGESGAGARFMHPHWVDNLRDQCTEAGVPLFFKGWGTRMMKKSDPNYMKIDGREWKEFPLGPPLVQRGEIPNENR